MAATANEINAFLFNIRVAFVEYGNEISKFQRLGRRDIEGYKMNLRILQHLVRIVVDFFDRGVDYETKNFFTVSEIHDVIQHINNICGTNYMIDLR